MINEILKMLGRCMDNQCICVRHSRAAKAGNEEDEFG